VGLTVAIDAATLAVVGADGKGGDLVGLMGMAGDAVVGAASNQAITR